MSDLDEFVNHYKATQRSVFTAAADYVASGISLVPIKADGSKQPAWGMLPIESPYPDMPAKRTWRTFQRRLPTEEELRQWYMGWGPICGIAVVCGQVSGGLEAIDLDSIDVAEPWMDHVRQHAPGLLDRLVVVESPRPGRHIYYRCSLIEGNQKLAQRSCVDEVTGLPVVNTLIETRGEGGYVLVPPSPGHCHPTGRPYRFLSEIELQSVPTISPEERCILLGAARAFHDVPNLVRQPAPAHPRPRSTDCHLPGDDFNARASWTELLERHGWTFLYDSGGVKHWTRPGKSEGTSATVNHANADLLHVFTSNAPPLEQDSSYSKFGFYTLLEHGGDFRAAACALRARGYGQVRMRVGHCRRSRHRRRRR